VSVIAGAMLFAGCIRTIAVDTMGGLISDGFEGFTSETDMEFAGQALPGNLKLIDVMLQTEPENTTLLRLASEGYASYALGYLEGADNVRARNFYLRAKDYGMRIVRQDAALARALDGSIEDFRVELAKRGKDDVPGLFWTAFGWGSAIQLSLDDPALLADLPRAEAIMEFVARADSGYYYGGAHLFLGALDGMRPRMLGGNPDRSRSHFEAALRLNHGDFLMTYVYYARTYAVQVQDEALFEELLLHVKNAGIADRQGVRLANAIARKKAEELLAKKSELF
jgi:hypothetical protein